MDVSNSADKQTIVIEAKQIRLGTLKFEPNEDVILTGKGIRIVAPHIKRPQDKIVLNIQKHEILKILYHLSKPFVLILYVANSCGKYIREQIEMPKDYKRKWNSWIACLIRHNIDLYDLLSQMVISVRSVRSTRNTY